MSYKNNGYQGKKTSEKKNCQNDANKSGWYDLMNLIGNKLCDQDQNKTQEDSCEEENICDDDENDDNDCNGKNKKNGSGKEEKNSEDVPASSFFDMSMIDLGETESQTSMSGQRRSRSKDIPYDEQFGNQNDALNNLCWEHKDLLRKSLQDLPSSGEKGCKLCQITDTSAGNRNDKQQRYIDRRSPNQNQSYGRGYNLDDSYQKESVQDVDRYRNPKQNGYENKSYNDETMKNREFIWGNNVPPEFIVPGTDYSKRHEKCCVGKQSDANKPYQCPNRGINSNFKDPYFEKSTSSGYNSNQRSDYRNYQNEKPSCCNGYSGSSSDSRPKQPGVINTDELFRSMEKLGVRSTENYEENCNENISPTISRNAGDLTTTYRSSYQNPAGKTKNYNRSQQDTRNRKPVCSFDLCQLPSEPAKNCPVDCDRVPDEDEIKEPVNCAPDDFDEEETDNSDDDCFENGHRNSQDTKPYYSSSNKMKKR